MIDPHAPGAGGFHLGAIRPGQATPFTRTRLLTLPMVGQ